MVDWGYMSPYLLKSEGFRSSPKWKVQHFPIHVDQGKVDTVSACRLQNSLRTEIIILLLGFQALHAFLLPNQLLECIPVTHGIKRCEKFHGLSKVRLFCSKSLGFSASGFILCWMWVFENISGWWLGHPSEKILKYESQLGWLDSQLIWENKKWQPNHQPDMFCQSNMCIPHCSSHISLGSLGDFSATPGSLHTNNMW